MTEAEEPLTTAELARAAVELLGNRRPTADDLEALAAMFIPMRIDAQASAVLCRALCYPVVSPVTRRVAESLFARYRAVTQDRRELREEIQDLVDGVVWGQE